MEAGGLETLSGGRAAGAPRLGCGCGQSICLDAGQVPACGGRGRGGETWEEDTA